MGMQNRAVAIGELTPALHLPGAGEGTEVGDFVDAPLAALTDQRLDEDR
ncbi:hypothetical protein JDM601_0686 [Mycolicibacter sinensis]|uniref:Uncharacterized protein n=1 Tax=Mycolicibacter sinensis (strain JDM601) TaxID=875328 RepID=F5Z3G0_MYCSD|nr:hypothetical protein JDM601_0686 [Mycolicibacter sinensis]